MLRRLRLGLRTRGARAAAAQRLPLEIGERAPQPLEGPEAVVLEPDRAHDELKHPNRHDDVVQLIALERAVETESETVEHERTDDRVRDVVRESHAADGRETPLQPL